MDRNSVIGFGLLILLLVGYIAYNNYSQSQYEEQKRADSVAHAKAHPKPLANDTGVVAADIPATAVDSVNDSLEAAKAPAFKGEAGNVVLQNDDVAITFSTKGAHPVKALLKNYKTYEQEPLYLFDGKDNQLSAVLPANSGAYATGDLFYTAEQKTTGEGYQSVVFTADMGEGKQVHITYTLPAEGYMLRSNIQLDGMKANSLPVTWRTEALHTEKDLNNERKNSQVYYKLTNGDDDYFNIEDEKETLEDPAKWVGFRLHFFATAIVAEDGMNRVDIDAVKKLDDSSIVARNTTTFELPLKDNRSANFQYYIGPNKYNVLRSHKVGLEEMVPLGYGPMFFVKYINKGLIIPIFNFLSKFITNYGIIIMLMTIIIRLLLSFFTYKSYLSAAKMRVLKPEIDELREQYKGDQQKFGMEQMKLYRQAGVNPLGGCLPTLFQLPILFAMFYFFPSSIELRQESFLWANDLSTYDSIASWDTHIPLLSSVYGNHISLFTILMTVSSLLLALYNRNMTAQDPNNPMMKYLPFIFPFMLLGIFNKMAAALTFYYFFSNLISIAQQFIIQKFVINEDAIHAKIQEKKNQPATKSKWQARLEQMQQAQLEKAKQQQVHKKK